MTQSQIQCFLMAAKNMSISKAAEDLFISQPAVSKQIAQLEKELGVKLFLRRNAKLEITPAGVKMDAFFREYEERFQNLVKEMEQPAQEVSGNVVVGCADGWDLSEFFQMLRSKLGQDYPGISVSLFCGNHDQLIYALNKGEIHLAIDQRESFIAQNNIITRPLRPVGMILLYSAKHPLAGKEALSLADFKDYPFYVTVPEGMDRPILDIIHACNMAGFQPRLEHLNSLSSCYVKMLSEYGVFAADELLLAKTHPIFHCMEFPGFRYISLARHKRQAKVCDVVEAYVINYFQRLFGDLEPV